MRPARPARAQPAAWPTAARRARRAAVSTRAVPACVAAASCRQLRGACSSAKQPPRCGAGLEAPAVVCTPRAPPRAAAHSLPPRVSVTRCRAAAAQGAGEPTAVPGDKLAVLEAFWQQAGPQTAVPADDVIALLAAETDFSPAQVQRWFSRRVLSQAVARPAAATAARGAPPSGALADALPFAEQQATSSERGSRRSSAYADGLDDDDDDDEVASEGNARPQGFGNWRRRLREDRDLVTEPEDEIGTSGTAEGDTELGGGLGAGDNISGDEEAAPTDGALEDMEDGAFEEDDDEEDEGEDEEDEDSEDVSRFATAGIDAIARKQAPVAMPRITEEMRRSSDKVDWDALSAKSLQIVETALQPRKQEWLVMEGKPVPGSKEQVHEGVWFEGDAALGWAALPDSEEMPRMIDGAMLEWANINTKLPNQEGYLEVDVEPPAPPNMQVIKWDDLPTPPMDEDIVFQHPDWEADGRRAHRSLTAGETLTGVVVDQHLYHGAFIDCGTEYNGLIWVSEPDWIRVRDTLDLGCEVTVRVREVRDPVRFRFPLELECVTPDVAHLIARPPPDYPPINLYDDEDIFEAALEAGREIPPPPDYEGMLADVREEVSENFSFPKDATKVKKPKVRKDENSSGDSDDSEEEEEGEEEEEEAPEAEE